MGTKHKTRNNDTSQASVLANEGKMYSFESSVTQCLKAFMTHKMIKSEQQALMINN